MFDICRFYSIGDFPTQSHLKCDLILLIKIKKIIIKEREEKRRMRQDQLMTNDDLTLDVANLNSSHDGTFELTLNSKQDVKLVELDSLEIDVDKNKDNAHRSGIESSTNSPKKAKTEARDQSQVGSVEIDKNATTNKLSNDEVDENENDDDEDDDDEDEDDDDDDNEEVEDNQTEENENTGAMSNQMSPISQGSPISIGGYSPSPYAALNGFINPDRALLSLEKLEEQVKQKIHSRKFREYCNQIINRDIDEVCSSLLNEIARFQDRLYHKNPIKVILTFFKIKRLLSV